MTEYELRNRLSAEIARRTHMQRELEKCQNENRVLKNRIDRLEMKISELRAEAMNFLTSQSIMTEEFQTQIYRLEREKAQLQEIVDSFRKRGSKL